MLKTEIKNQVKEAMKAKNMARLGVLRQITAAIKQIEVDTREELNEDGVLALLEKMKKQRLDAMTQFKEASRDDLAEKEQQELNIIQEFMPTPLDADQLEKIIADAITAVEASAIKDMSKVMAHLKPQVLGRASMKEVGEKIKAKLEG
jgi:uncharacterized protein YqeY